MAEHPLNNEYALKNEGRNLNQGRSCYGVSTIGKRMEMLKEGAYGQCTIYTCMKIEQ
jgi:hypothetical protein